MATLTEKKIAAQFNIPIWYNLFVKLGIDVNKIPFLLAQLSLETGYFTSKPYKLNKNPGGITWNVNYNKRPGTSKGSARPLNEGGNYVLFDTYETAAKDYIRILNKKGLKGKPLEAIELNDYVNRLAANKYFDVQTPGSINQYKKNIISIDKRLQGWNDYATLGKKKNNLAYIGIGFSLLALGYFLK